MRTFASPQRSYQLVTESDMEPDPARAAIRMGMVDRHGPEYIRAVGAWRWPCLQKHRELILTILRLGNAVDFGGAAGPVGYGATVVDYGADVKTLADLDFPPLTIFSSHTLEHLDNLAGTLDEMAALIQPDGYMIHHAPSFRSEKWRAENWPHHNTTFCLERDSKQPGWVALDAAFTSRGFEVLAADDYCNSILVIGQKCPPT